MKTYGTLLASALALALTACGDSGGSGGGLSVLTGGEDPQQPANPLNPGNDDPQLPANPINPGSDNPQQPANPGTPGSPTSTTGASELPAGFLNGPDLDNFTSFWLCEDVGETEPTNFFSMRFLENGQGAYGGGGTITAFTWSATGNNVDFVIPDNSRNFTFSNIEFSDEFTFNTQFEITDESPLPTICALYGLDDQPFGNELPSLGGATEPTTQPPPDTQRPPTSGTGSIDELLLNVTNSDVWLCTTTTNAQLAIGFEAGGGGAILTNPDEDAVPFRWAISEDTVVFSINSTADSFIGGIVFSGENSFASETANIAGDDVGPLTCERVS